MIRIVETEAEAVAFAGVAVANITATRMATTTITTETTIGPARDPHWANVSCEGSAGLSAGDHHNEEQMRMIEH